MFCVIDLPTLASNALAVGGLLLLIMGLVRAGASVMKRLGIGNADTEDKVIHTADEIAKYAGMAVGAVKQITRNWTLPETPLVKAQQNAERQAMAIDKLMRDVPGITKDQAIDYVEHAVGELAAKKLMHGVAVNVDPTPRCPPASTSARSRTPKAPSASPTAPDK